MAAEIYQVGRDEISIPERDDSVVWLVYDYESEWYEGWGEAVWLTKDGNLHRQNLGHCSCYDGFDGVCWDQDPYPINQYFENLDKVHSYIDKESVAAKVNELLGVK